MLTLDNFIVAPAMADCMVTPLGTTFIILKGLWWLYQNRKTGILMCHQWQGGLRNFAACAMLAKWQIQYHCIQKKYMTIFPDHFRINSSEFHPLTIDVRDSSSIIQQ
jgi:hypothetical protein